MLAAWASKNTVYDVIILAFTTKPANHSNTQRRVSRDFNPRKVNKSHSNTYIDYLECVMGDRDEILMNFQVSFKIVSLLVVGIN